MLWSCWLLVFGISFWCHAWLVVGGDAFALAQGVFWVSSVLSIGCLVVLRLGLFALQRLCCGSGDVDLGSPALCCCYLLFWCFVLPW